MLLKYCSHRANSIGDDPFHQREEQVFLAGEVCVEGAAGKPGAGGDVLEARGFKSIARKDVLGGIE